MAMFRISGGRDGEHTAEGRARPESPEEAFFAWLLWLPRDADVADRALAEIARIDLSTCAGTGTARLRALFAEAAGISGRMS